MPSTQKFVKDWKIDELAGDIDQIREGRSFESGKSIFGKSVVSSATDFKELAAEPALI